MKINSTDLGQALIEIVVAIGIIVFALVGVLAAVTRSIKTARVANNQAEAIRYAELVLEEIKQDKDRNLEDFFTMSPLEAGYCRSLRHGSFWGNYAVTVTCVFDSPQSDQVSVQVTVSWPEGNNTLSVNLETVLAKVRY